MENNNNWNWYESNTPNAGAPYNAPTSGNQGNGRERKEKRHGVTWAQMIACMLVMCLLGAGIGVGVMRLAGSNSAADQGAPVGQYSVTATPSPTATATPSSGIVVSSGSNSAASDEESGAIIRSSMSSVVGIDIEQQVTTSYGYGYFGGSSGESSSETVGSGSGVIVTADGYIVTNNHVIEGADTIKVHLQDGTEYEASLIGTDSITDLAVIKIEASGLPAATLGSSSSMLVGDAVYAIGNPLGVLATSVSRGIVSGLDRVIEVEGQEMTLMQTDAAVNPGNSGGGLFNSAGELIGIVNAKSSGTDVEGLGFAIPIDSARPVIADLIDLGFVTGRPYLGINMQNIIISNGYSGGFNPFGQAGYTYRVQVVSIEEGSAAQAAGMQVNDIIVSLNGTEVTGSSDLSALLYEYSVGDVVTITVQRGSGLVDLSVTLGERTKA